jgi:5-methyltetrahydropteroyltriglutamate--homocysteine methyltransferase
VRADVVGSLLRPEYLRETRDAARAGTIDAGEVRAAEDRAVLEAIALQESAGSRRSRTASTGATAGSR